MITSAASKADDGATGEPSAACVVNMQVTVVKSSGKSPRNISRHHVHIVDEDNSTAAAYCSRSLCTIDQRIVIPVHDGRHTIGRVPRARKQSRGRSVRARVNLCFTAPRRSI